MYNFKKQYEFDYIELEGKDDIIQKTITQQSLAMKTVFGVSCKIQTQVIDMRGLEKWKEGDTPEEEFCHRYGIVRLYFKVTWEN